MKYIIHGMLKHFSNVFKTKGHLCVGESSPRVDKSCLGLVIWFDFNLVISRESIHEGKYLTSNTVVIDLVNEPCWVIFLWKNFVQIMEVSTHANGSMFLIYWNGIGYPFGKWDGVDEASSEKLLYLSFNCLGFLGIDDP